jgi:hypothetical protein
MRCLIPLNKVPIQTLSHGLPLKSILCVISLSRVEAYDIDSSYKSPFEDKFQRLGDARNLLGDPPDTPLFSIWRLPSGYLGPFYAILFPSGKASPRYYLGTRLVGRRWSGWLLSEKVVNGKLRKDWKIVLDHGKPRRLGGSVGSLQRIMAGRGWYLPSRYPEVARSAMLQITGYALYAEEQTLNGLYFRHGYYRSDGTLIMASKRLEFDKWEPGPRLPVRYPITEEERRDMKLTTAHQ